MTDMQADEPNLQQLTADLVRMLRLRKHWLIVPTVLLGSAAIAIAFMLPPTYRSFGTILVEKPNVPADLVETTIAANDEEQIEKIRRQFIARDNLIALIHEHELYPGLMSEADTDAALSRMREALTVHVMHGGRRNPTVAFEVAFEYGEAEKTYAVARTFADWYLTENARTRREKARDTADFLQQQTSVLDQEVTRLERRYAEFKDKHAGRLPNQTELKTAQLADATGQLRDLNIEEQNLRDRRADLVRRRVAVRTEGSDVSSPVRQRLEELQQEHGRLSLRLTERHPDIIALEQEIQFLEARAWKKPPTRDLPEARELSDQIALLDRQIASLDRRRALVRREIEGIEADLKHAASIADEYRTLQREYESAVSDYSVLRRKQLTADMGASLELNEKGERFTLIEPPQLPVSADGPNRKLIAGGGVFGAFGVGAGMLLLAALFDRSVGGPRALEKLTGVPPLIVLPEVRTRSDRLRTWGKRVAMLAGLAAIVVVVNAYLLPLEPLVTDILFRTGFDLDTFLPMQIGGDTNG